MAGLQTRRAIDLATPLGADVLLFRSMTVFEELGRPFELRLHALSSDDDITLEDLLGKNVTVRLELPDGASRYFNGFVTSFCQAGRYSNYAAYRVTLRPWLWLLTRTADCRIFQEKTVPDIIKEIFRDRGLTDFQESLSGSYRTREYCVQYRETDFNFVSRLMEEEGIYYYFTHENGKHTLVLSDSYSAHDAFPGYAEVPYFPPDEHALRERDHIYDWATTQEMQPGVYALNDFDFERPKAALTVKSSAVRHHPWSDAEVYDYPGGYTESADGDNYVRARIEELQAEYERVEGKGDARGLAVGSLFTLTNYPREDQNREYLITSATHQLHSDEYETVRGSGGTPLYSSKFSAIDSKQPYRAPRVTTKPTIQGPQTAVVVGKAGEEIWTDKYGRVKVQFHWDREGTMDENSSCWVRVSQPWAGKNWGAVFLPRIGQEVIVDFLEGDPDRPIITGRVYNADNMPPYELSANQTQSGIKTRSSKGGTGDNFNEIRFEDKKGAEQLYIHAERALSTVVEAGESRSVGGSRSTTVQQDETLTIKKGNRTETLEEGNDQLTIQLGDRTVEVSTGNDTLRVPAGTRTVQALKVDVQGQTEIQLTCGAGTIKMTPGTIELTIGGSSIQMNPGMISINAPLVKVNC